MMPLVDLAAGLPAVIAEVLSPPGRRNRLAAYGLVRGTAIRVLQRTPALVVAVDGTELALDPRIGHEIRVRRA